MSEGVEEEEDVCEGSRGVGGGFGSWGEGFFFGGGRGVGGGGGGVRKAGEEVEEKRRGGEQ